MVDFIRPSSTEEKRNAQSETEVGEWVLSWMEYARANELKNTAGYKQGRGQGYKMGAHK